MGKDRKPGNDIYTNGFQSNGHHPENGRPYSLDNPRQDFVPNNDKLNLRQSTLDVLKEHAAAHPNPRGFVVQVRGIKVKGNGIGSTWGKSA